MKKLTMIPNQKLTLEEGCATHLIIANKAIFALKL